MLKELYGTSMIKYENKEEIIEYYLLNSEGHYENINNDNINNNTKNKIKMYGIEIVKKSNMKEESSFISDLTVNKSFAEEIIKTIKDNVVTPIHLYDVLENFL